MQGSLRATLAATAAVLSMSVAGCAIGGEDEASASDGPIKVGLITDVTGPAAAGQEYAVIGAQARIDALNADGGIDGRKVELVVGDTASSPQGTLTAAKKLIQQDKVSALLSWTYLYNAAADFVASKKIPVFGGSWDSAPGWAKHETMFGSQPAAGSDTIAATTYGEIFTMRKASKIAVVGLDSPSAKHATDGTAEAAKGAGLDVVYLNQSVAATDNDFTSVALAIKKAGADGVYASLPSAQVYALASALRQQDVDLKIYLGATGYGQALLDNATALEGAEGAVFVHWYAGRELESDASKKMAENLEKYADYTGSFDFSAAGSYLDAVGFIAAAEAADGDLTPEGITQGARSLSSFDFEGLLAAPADWSKPIVANGPGLGYDNCAYLSTVEDGKFVPLVKEPICGSAEIVD